MGGSQRELPSNKVFKQYPSPGLEAVVRLNIILSLWINFLLLLQKVLLACFGV